MKYIITYCHVIDTAIVLFKRALDLLKVVLEHLNDSSNGDRSIKTGNDKLRNLSNVVMQLIEKYSVATRTPENGNVRMNSS